MSRDTRDRKRARMRKKVNAEPDPTEEERNWAFVERCVGTPGVRTLYLWGPPGTGKSHAAFHAGGTGRGVYAIALTEETPAAELRGFFRPDERGMVWQDGPMVMAMREGARLVINELGHAGPDVLALLYPVLESVDTARITLPTGETVAPAEGFSCIATSNDPPNTLPLALRDRFDATIEVNMPHPAAFERLPEHLRGPAKQTWGLGEDRQISVRGWLAIARLEPEFGLRDACRAVFGNERGARVFEGLELRQLSFEGGA